jgi:rubredoxin
MSTRTANGQSRKLNPYDRGPEWRKFEQALKRERGWKCERCGAQYDPSNATDLWACHLNPFEWSTSPATRYDKTKIACLCPRCDPDRNPKVRPEQPSRLHPWYWADPTWKASTPGRKHRRPHKLAPIGWFLLANLLWVGALVADGHLRHFASLRPYLIGAPGSSFTALLTWLGTLLGLWGACYVLAAWACRHHWLRRSMAFAWRIPGRAWRMARGPRKAPDATP